jgi:hypothetical protein
MDKPAYVRAREILLEAGLSPEEFLTGEKLDPEKIRERARSLINLHEALVCAAILLEGVSVGRKEVK